MTLAGLEKASARHKIHSELLDPIKQSFIKQSTIQNTTKQYLKKSQSIGTSKYILLWIKGHIWRLMKERDHALQTFLDSPASLRNNVTKDIRKQLKQTC